MHGQSMTTTARLFRSWARTARMTSWSHPAGLAQLRRPLAVTDSVIATAARSHGLTDCPVDNLRTRALGEQCSWQRAPAHRGLGAPVTPGPAP